MQYGTMVNKLNPTKNIRLIARLDIKGSNLIKGIHLEGLRVIGSPGEYALRYYLQGADELIYMDCVASLYGRNHLADIVRSAAENIFVPMTVVISGPLLGAAAVGLASLPSGITPPEAQ